MTRPIGVVLAGGAGRRMGRDKGGLERDGVTLAARAARALGEVCEEVLISLAPGDTRHPVPGFRAVRDAEPAGRGPLAGILAAFEVAGREDLLVLACDYPFVEAPLLRAILAAAREEDALVMPAETEGRDHPLVALWRRGSEDCVRRALASGRLKVHDVLAELRVRRLGPDDLAGFDLTRVLSNWNRPEDLDAHTT